MEFLRKLSYPMLKGDVCDEILHTALKAKFESWDKADIETKALWWDAIIDKIDQIYISEEKLREARMDYMRNNDHSFEMLHEEKEALKEEN